MTPIPTYARVAINDVRNAIFQRMRDITRRGGSAAYQQAVNGLNLGVDLRGNTMNGFLGIKVLTELLIMGRVGVYVDSPLVPGNATLADVKNYRPYLYFYPIEDILSWTCAKPDEPSTFQALLLRDVVLNFDQRTYLPTTTVERFRMLWIDRDTGKVNLQFLDTAGNPVDREGNPAGAVELELSRIPFVLLDIGDSMIKDVVNHQIALLNLVSSDVNYALKSNFPFYVEQKDQRAGGQHLKQGVNEDGTASTGGQAGADTDIKVGATQGRTYDKGMNAPAFINPSSEPLKASMDLQGKLEDDIRKLIHLAVAETANRATAESKAMDNQGLEAGLSYIGLVLEAAERQIAEFWAAYEERTPSQRNVATVKYPDRYSLKTDSDRIGEAEDLVKLMYAVPGQKVNASWRRTSSWRCWAGRSASATSRPFSTRSTKPLMPPATRRPSLRRSRRGCVARRRPRWRWVSTMTSTCKPARITCSGRFGFCRPSRRAARWLADHRGHEPRSSHGEVGRFGIDGLERSRGEHEQRPRGPRRIRSFGQSRLPGKRKSRPAATRRSTTRRNLRFVAKASDNQPQEPSP